MNALLNRLNLHPSERRLVAIVIIVVFAVVNFVFVVPHFGDWAKARQKLKEARDTLALYQKETDPVRLAEYQRKRDELEQQGSRVLPSEQSLELIRVIQTQAVQHGVTILDQRELNTTVNTNDFFEEKGRVISITGEEKSIVNFLTSLSTGNYIIRVRSMSLKPHTDMMHLQGNLTLVASYQKGVSEKKPDTAVQPKKVNPPARRETANKS
jgi:Tfp pilus assembly protein PilO